MAAPGRKTGWRKKDQRETLPLSTIWIEKGLREWLKTQDNQTTTVERALIDYRKKIDCNKAKQIANDLLNEGFGVIWKK